MEATAQTEAGSASTVSISQFPDATQPDIVRAAIKDGYYRKLLNRDTQEVLLQIMGPRWITDNSQELKLFSNICYYGLTTLIGAQTLGEEYCDIVQVTDTPNLCPSTNQRLFLLSCAVLVPYVFKKAASKILVMARPRFTSQQFQPFTPFRQRLGGEDHLERDKEIIFSPVTAFLAWWHGIKTAIDSYRFNEPVASFLTDNIPRVKNAIKILKRAHLGAFYMFGVYYHVSKRVSSIHYIFNRKLDQNRTKYSVLGILIFMQLLLQLGLWMHEQARKRASSSIEEDEEGQGESLSSSSSPSSEKVPSEDSLDSSSAGSSASETDSAEEFPSVHQCALCLEARTHTTATACGHLFCWTCVHEACKVKPVCPVCRRTITPQTLTRLYHYD